MNCKRRNILLVSGRDNIVQKLKKKKTFMLKLSIMSSSSQVDNFLDVIQSPTDIIIFCVHCAARTWRQLSLMNVAFPLNSYFYGKSKTKSHRVVKCNEFVYFIKKCAPYFRMCQTCCLQLQAQFLIELARLNALSSSFSI